MAENVIRERHPELYSLISKSSSNIDWVTIDAMLESLFYLKFENIRASDLVSNIFSLMDSWGQAELGINKLYNLLKLTKVKLTITAFLSKLSDKQEIDQICSSFKSSLSFNKFTSSSRSILTCNPDIFPASCLKVYETFSELRKQATGILMFFEKYLKMMKSQNIAEMVDRAFFENIILEFKSQIQSESTTKSILADFTKFCNQGVSRDDTISVSSSAFAKRAKNQYSGEFNETEQRHGYGKVSFATGDSFEGFWQDGKKCGQGLYRFRNGGSYLGEFLDDLSHGKGVRVYSSGNYYDGMFLAGKKHGIGIMNFRNGDKYEGEWDNDDMHGHGTYSWSSGDKFTGGFNRDNREGAGILHLATGQTIEGIWKNNILSI